MRPFTVALLVAVALATLAPASINLLWAQQPTVRSPMRTPDDRTPVTYANLVYVGGTAEELVIDFAFQGEVNNPPPAPVNQRMIMSYFAAKRLSLALQAQLDKYERMFGPIELDPSRRVKPGK